MRIPFPVASGRGRANKSMREVVCVRQRQNTTKLASERHKRDREGDRERQARMKLTSYPGRSNWASLGRKRMPCANRVEENGRPSSDTVSKKCADHVHHVSGEPSAVLIVVIRPSLSIIQRKEQTAEGNFWLCFFGRNRTRGTRSDE